MTEKITISGAPPQWDDAEYQRRFALELHKYRNTRDCMEFIHTALEYDFHSIMIEKYNQGYRLNKHYPASHDHLSHAIYMTKPDEQQQADIEKLKEKVKEDYVSHLESERARYQDLLRQQLIQTQQEKELKALQEKQAKQLALIEKEVQACYAPLVIPE
ncbi:hypothetical protein [Pseudomonas putida]|uniref:Uncharacterized protein n=1 Tax=Pseudomonas putida TaxID=303 RepID=A0A1X1A4J2_PSEPU|nr:hypothetical protein [Pseudomonas putida]ORL66775.1 hypothetical protein B7H17_03765 [Pseudomonas putida]